MLSWLVYSSTLSRGLPLNSSWSSRRALLRNRPTWRSYFWLISLKMTLKYLCRLSSPLSRRRESRSKCLWRDFSPMSKRHDPSTLVKTYRHNLQTILRAQIGVVECRTWKQLVLQGEKAEKIIARVKAEKKKVSQVRRSQCGELQTKRYSSNKEYIFCQNPTRLFLGVAGYGFLGFIIISKGIHLN